MPHAPVTAGVPAPDPGAHTEERPGPRGSARPSPGLLYRGQVLLGVVSHVHLGYTRCRCLGLGRRVRSQPYLHCLTSEGPRGRNRGKGRARAGRSTNSTNSVPSAECAVRPELNNRATGEGKKN